MNYEQIETFLTVVTRGSISAAAKELFVTQSTVSTRIKSLEEELGAPLLIRAKGHHTVELTSYGSAFIPMASQWTALWKHTQNLRDAENKTTLTIASIDSVNNFALVPLFRQHIERYPDICLSIRTHHSNEIHGLVQSRLADIGFVFSRANVPNIISRPVYRELMYLICHKDSPYHENTACEELDPEQEVYLRWGQDYQQWHDRHWPGDRYPAITVNTGSTIRHFINSPGRWAIAPMSVIHQIQDHEDIVYYSLKESPPPRICYEITNRHTTLGHQNALDIFRKELNEFIRQDPDICVFEQWMLDDHSAG